MLSKGVYGGFPTFSIFSKALFSNARVGSCYLLSPSNLPCRNAIFFTRLKNQILIVSPSIARKIMGVESLVKRQDIESSVTIELADGDAGNLYSINKLSDKVCARPCSAASKDSSTSLILSNDAHKHVYVSSYSSRKYIF